MNREQRALQEVRPRRGQRVFYLCVAIALLSEIVGQRGGWGHPWEQVLTVYVPTLAGLLAALMLPSVLRLGSSTRREG
jgi:hypothetical protein